MMGRLIQTRFMDRYDTVVFLFANTGEENEQTLEFVQRCDAAFGFSTVWVEAVVRPEKGQGTTHRVVTYETASRRGEPYEAVIQKYGIPNAKFPHCTRELKQAPMYSYVRSVLGWKRGEYDVAIGIRADESRRCDRTNPYTVYPLADWVPVTKPDVNSFWQAQPFRLNLTGYQGNCKWCWKKGTRKLLTIMDETPEAFDFPQRMEHQYGGIGPEFEKVTAPGYRRVFFHKNTSTADLRAMHACDEWTRAENDAIIYKDRPVWLDTDADCAESCDVRWDVDKT